MTETLTYRVTYAHENDNATDDKKKHGYAVQELQVDHEIRTQDDVVEIARQIGHEFGHTKVAIVKIEQKIETDEGDED